VRLCLRISSMRRIAVVISMPVKMITAIIDTLENA
jgi:hypothetical protein